MFLMGGCSVGDEVASDDQKLATELLAGWPAPEEMYEVRDLVCVKRDDRVEATATIVNKNDFAWAFGVEMVFHTAAGETTERRTDQGFWEAGQEVEISQWAGTPERFDDSPRCEVVVYHGADLAFRDADRKTDTYERLGWDPTKEERID